jgi:hypothetical protein
MVKSGYHGILIDDIGLVLLASLRLFEDYRLSVSTWNLVDPYRNGVRRNKVHKLEQCQTRHLSPPSLSSVLPVTELLS